MTMLDLSESFYRLRVSLFDDRMRPTDIKDKLGDLPYMRLDQAEQLFSFLRSYDLKTCLELGFYHGVSSAYIAGALQELGTGSLTTIDLEWARQLKPNIYEILT